MLLEWGGKSSIITRNRLGGERFLPLNPKSKPSNNNLRLLLRGSFLSAASTFNHHIIMLSSAFRKTRHQQLRRAALLLLVFFVYALLNSQLCLADEDEDFLAEILAEEAKHEEEHARLEAEMKEMEAIRAQQQQNNYQNTQKGGGKPKMGRSNNSMPKGGSFGSDFSKLEEELKRKEAEQSAFEKANQASAEEEANAKKAEQVRLQREAAYAASLKKMNEEERKKAQKQKAADAKIVSRILKHASKGK